MTPKAYEFHPLAQEYPLIDGLDAAAMEADMRECGFDSTFPVVLFEGKILDGRGRYTVARKVGIEPLFVQWEPASRHDTPAAFVARANENRRPLDAVWLTERRTQRRAKRIEQVAELRRSGDSLRVIGEKLGISLVQVQRDIDEYGAKTTDTKTQQNIEENNCTPPGTVEKKETSKAEPKDGKVTGRDGKTRTANPKKPKKPKEPKAVKADPQPDHDVNAKPKAATEPEEEEPKIDHGTDAEGVEVPAELADAFACREKFREIFGLFTKAEKLIHALATLPGGRILQREAKHVGEGDKLRYRIDTIQKTVWFLRTCQPHTRCPYCHHAHPGAIDPNCNGCKGAGWVNKRTWEGAHAEYREAVLSLKTQTQEGEE